MRIICCLSLIGILLSTYAAESTDGKLHLSSDPAGASILLIEQGGELKDLGLKTPSLVRVPKGLTKIVMRLQGYQDGHVEAFAGDAITKVEQVKLEKPKLDVDVVANELDGFAVFVDGKPVLDKTGKDAIAPCTIQLPEGEYTLGLAKDGFRDFTQRIAVKANVQIDVTEKAVKGTSILMKVKVGPKDEPRATGKSEKKTIVGKWTCNLNNNIHTFNADNTVVSSSGLSGKWNVEGNTYIVLWRNSTRIVINDIKNKTMYGIENNKIKISWTKIDD